MSASGDNRTVVMTALNPTVTTTQPAPPWMARAWQVLHDNTPAGLAILDDQLRYVAVNSALAARSGVPAEGHLGKTPHEVVPGLAETIQRASAQVLATGRPMLGLEVSGTVSGEPGLVRHWIESVYPVPGPDGSPVGVAVLVWEVTDRRRADREAAARRAAEADTHRLLVLHRLAAALADAADTLQVAGVVVALAGQTLRAESAAVVRFDGTMCQVIAATAARHAEHSRVWQPFEISAVPLLREVLGSDPHAISWSSAAEKDLRYPPTSDRAFVTEAGAIAPLLVDGRPTGFVGIGWQHSHTVAPADVDLLETVAAQTAAAIERARSLEAKRRAQHRLRLLADVSAQLACAGDETEQLSQLATLLLNGGFADSVSVFLPDETGTLRRHIVVAADADLNALYRGFIGTPMAHDDPRQFTWRTGEPMVTTLTDTVRRARWEGVLPELVRRVQDRVGNGHTITVPLSARGRRLGVFIAVRHDERAHPFDDDDLQLLTDVGQRAGIAIDNLRLLAAQTRIASRLQQILLPDRLPTIDGVELAARYLAAEHDADVGGDFYDVFPVGDAYALVIGDVAGRGVDAAGLTGIARVALRTLADHLSPPEMLARLNTLLTERSGHTSFLTVAFALLRPHPGGATVHTWLAGHPRPLLIHPDGTISELGTPGHLLGILPDVTHHQHTCELAPGDLLLLYTDGLTEAHGPDGLYGRTLLPAHLTRLAGASAASTVAQLTQAVTDYRAGSSVDDTVVLAVRLPVAADLAVQASAVQASAGQGRAGQSSTGQGNTGQGNTGLGSAESVPATVHTTVRSALQTLGDRVSPREIRLQLAAAPQIVPSTRQLLQAACHSWRLTEVTQPASLVLTELVTNAVRHVGGTVEVCIAHRDDLLCLAVGDQDTTPPVPTELVLGRHLPPDELPAHGRGLHLVAAYTTDWGCTTTLVGKTVWATIHVRGPIGTWSR